MSSRNFTPSNSDDGLGFEMMWCDKCERDRGYREDVSRPDLGCYVLAGAYAGDMTEWIYDDHGTPYCRQFIPEGEELPVEVADGQLTFGEEKL